MAPGGRKRAAPAGDAAAAAAAEVPPQPKAKAKAKGAKQLGTQPGKQIILLAELYLQNLILNLQLIWLRCYWCFMDEGCGWVGGGGRGDFGGGGGGGVVVI